ncbi:ead/Ea22-like family protein, partial [Klebsiella pneumoniae]|nr:ead/Ea22-like family protein [Klebsiella pneumoniae]
IDAKELAIIARYSKGRAAAEKFYALANPNNVIALVEALEKAQRANAAQDDHINQQQDRIDQLEKGHQEAAKQINSWRRMAKQNIAEREKDIAELDAARQRIAELESRTVTAAAAAVLAERKRQVAAEGWTPGHDDEYEHGELADAAGCYALSSELFDCAGEPPRPWPWPDEWWKPTNRRRDLVKAGALILAEIERLDRAAGIKVEAE